jgi:glutathione S-transferase
MAQLKLAIANKNYSSWSMRPWVLLTQAGIAFEEIQLRFGEDDRGNLLVLGIEPYSSARTVPVLMVDGQPVWDSLAICETLAELFPEKRLWPVDARARQVARSVCAEMHSGFRALRGAMPMNIRSSLPGKGMSPEVQKDVDRVVEIWRSCRERFGQGGEMLFGQFSIADAYFAPVTMRLKTYAVKVPEDAERYAAAVRALPGVRKWIDAAASDTEFVPAVEPYATKPAGK